MLLAVEAEGFAEAGFVDAGSDGGHGGQGRQGGRRGVG